MGERERSGGTLNCLLSKNVRDRERSSSILVQERATGGARAAKKATCGFCPLERKADLSCIRISYTKTRIDLVGLVACAARCGTHKNQPYKNFSFTRENCREGVSV